MKLKFKPLISILFFVCLFSSLSYSQSRKPIWNEVSKSELKRVRLLSKSVLKKTQYYTLDIDGLNAKLRSAVSKKNNYKHVQIVQIIPVMY